MAVKNQAKTITLTAAADYSTLQYRFVYESSEGVATLATDTQNSSEANVYVLQNTPASGEPAECAVLNGQTLLNVGTTGNAIGDEIMIGTSGVGAARAGANKYARARVSEVSTAANQFVVVTLTQPVYVTT